MGVGVGVGVCGAVCGCVNEGERERGVAGGRGGDDGPHLEGMPRPKGATLPTLACIMGIAARTPCFGNVVVIKAAPPPTNLDLFKVRS